MKAGWMLGVILAAATSSAAAAEAKSEGKPAPVPLPAAMRLAGEARTDETGEVKFTLSYQPGEAWFVAEGPDVVVEKHLTKDAVSVRVTSKGDVIEFSANRNGALQVGRKGKGRRYRIREKPERRVGEVQTMLAASPAVLALESLSNYLEASERPEAKAVHSTFALLESIRGSNAAARAFSKRIRRPGDRAPIAKAVSTTGREENVVECWMQYAWSLTIFSYQYETCYNNWWWNPFGSAACAFEYSLQAELALFEVIACAGGMPI